MITSFGDLRGIIPPIYRETKQAKLEAGQLVHRNASLKIDGRYTRWWLKRWNKREKAGFWKPKWKSLFDTGFKDEK